MAKKFTDIYKKYKTTVLKNPQNVLLVLAKMNTAAKIKEDLAPNGATDGTTSQFTLQRRVRNLVKDVKDPNSGATSDALALLDSFDKVKWESASFATGSAKSIGFKTTINDKLDMNALEDKHAEDVRYQTAEMFLDRNKTIYSQIATDAKSKAATYDIEKADGTSETITVPALPAYAADKDNVWNGINEAVIQFNDIDDKFKSESSGIVFVSQLTASDLTREMGIVFKQEAPIAQTGFKTGYSINSTPVVVDPKLKGRVAYIIDEEALFFKKSPSMEDVDQKLGTTRYVGKVFYDVFATADKNRIWKLV